MASLPYMKFYPGDYLSDTVHLTTVEHGAYLLLILSYWERGPLPDNDTRLAATAKLDRRQWARVRVVISEFFTVDGGLWRHRRIDRELAQASERSSKARQAVSVRYECRPGEPTDVPTNAPTRELPVIVRSQKSYSEVRSQSHSSSLRSEEKKPPNPLAGAFASVWPEYVNTVGRKAAERHFRASVKTEDDLAAIRQALVNYKRHLQANPEKPAQNGSTWFNDWRAWQEWQPWMARNGHAPREQTREERLAELKAKGIV